MTTRHLIDPETLPIVEAFVPIDPMNKGVEQMRALVDAFTAQMPDPAIAPHIVMAPGLDGAPDVPLHIYTPSGGNRRRPVILHIHGGAMISGSAAMAKRYLPELTEEHDAIGVSIDYRLAPETPFPGPQQDCLAGLRWVAANAGALNIDPCRIVVMGESAGGGLAASLALMARDHGGPQLAGQILVYPMLDHRTSGPDDRWNNPIAGEFVFTPDSNRFGWAALRGDYAADDHRKGWFSPALAEDLSGLPPTFITVGQLDVIVDETLDYARRLAAAGVLVECHLFAGGVHAFDGVPEARIARESKALQSAALGRFLGR